ncbi:MAG: HEAT repeat domain-containing protein [Elusimicrobia bacterium]|nr:HEAT repeat domain-containing protein [Elusimicrobiota bacterium]
MRIAIQLLALAAWAGAVARAEDQNGKIKIGAASPARAQTQLQEPYPGGMPATPPDELPVLTRTLRGGDWNERIHAVHSLGAMGAPAAGALALALEDPDWQVRFTAVHWLGRIGQPAIPSLERALREEPCRIVRISALHWLGSLGEEGLAAVEEGLQDESGVMRLNAWYWLRKEEVIPRNEPSPTANPEEDLNVCRSSSSPMPRRKAKQTKGAEEAPKPSEAESLPPPEEAPPPSTESPELLFPEAPKPPELDEQRAREIDALLAEDSFPKRRPPAAESLRTQPPIEMRGSPEVHGEGALMEDAGAPKPAHDPLPGLLESLRSADAKARSRAADELGKMGPKAGEAVEPLRRLLRDLSPRVRSSAILALGNIGVPAAASVKDIVKALRDPSAAVRYSAALALSRIDTPAAKKAFNRYLRREALKSVQPSPLKPQP